MQIIKSSAQLFTQRKLCRPFYNVTTLIHQNANPKQNVVRSYEGIKDYADFTKKPPYTFKMKKKADKFVRKIEFEFYKKRLREEAERMMKGEKAEEVEKEEVDELWGAEVPPARKYEKIIQKELQWIPRSENYFSESNRKINYLPLLVPPFKITDADFNNLINDIKTLSANAMLNPDPDFDLEGFYLNNEEIKQRLLSLEQKIATLHPSVLPNAALTIAFELRYKNDKLRIWEILEQRAFKYLYQYESIEIAKLRHAFTGNFPKTASQVTQKAMLDVVRKELFKSNPEEILYIYHSFRTYHNLSWHQTILNEITTRSAEFHKVQNPDFLGNLLYTYANCRIPKRERGIIREPQEEDREAARILELYLDQIIINIKDMSTDTVARVALAFSVLNLKGYEDAAINIEKAVVKRAAQLDSFQVVSFLYSLSRFNKNTPTGQKKTYTALEPLVKKFWNGLTNLDRSKIFFAYTARGLASSELLNNYFLKWVQENIDKLHYNELHNVAYSLMFLGSTDQNIWRRFFKNIAKQPKVVPFPYYHSLNFAKYYASGLFPKWNFQTFDDAAQQASFAFHLNRKTHEVEDKEFKRASQLITTMEIDWKVFIEWQNLFFIDYAILPQQLAVLLQKSSDTFVDDGVEKPRPALLLKKKILELHGWKVLTLNFREFIEKGEERTTWLNTVVQKAYKEQNAHYEKVMVPAKWEEFFDKVYDINDRALTEYDVYQELVEERLEEEKKKEEAQNSN